MAKHSAPINLLLLVTVFISCEQTQKPVNYGNYFIDNSITPKIEKKLNTVEFKLFENDKIINDTYSHGKSDECKILTSGNADKVYIYGFAGDPANFGFQIELFKDTCIVRYFVKAEMEIYKFMKTDSLTTGISVPCRTFTLTLLNKPAFKDEEIIQGIVELTSEDYYELANGKENKYKIQLTGYFRTNPIRKLSLPD